MRESMDVSLAEELTAARLKKERLKMERYKTEKMLEERDHILKVQLTQLHQRRESQKKLKIKVDRLYKLMNQLKLVCIMQRMLPIQSLRDKEMEKKNKNHSA